MHINELTKELYDSEQLKYDNSEESLLTRDSFGIEIYNVEQAKHFSKEYDHKLPEWFYEQFENIGKLCDGDFGNDYTFIGMHVSFFDYYYMVMKDYKISFCSCVGALKPKNN